MAEEPEAENSKHGIGNYLSSAVKVHPQTARAGEKNRAFIKWAFDFLRNTLMVGSVYYLGLKISSTWLIGISWFFALLLYAHVWSYLDAITFHVFPRREWSFINVAISVLITSALSLTAIFGIREVVEQIANANLAKP